MNPDQSQLQVPALPDYASRTPSGFLELFPRQSSSPSRLESVNPSESSSKSLPINFPRHTVFLPTPQYYQPNNFHELHEENGDFVQGYAAAASDPGEDNLHPMPALESLLKKLYNLNLTGEVQGKVVRIVAGGCADIYVWVLADGKHVAEKRIRFYAGDDLYKVAKRVARELRIWFKLQHPNVLPLRGYVIREGSPFPSIITDWMENGSLYQFLKNNSEVDEIKMVKGITEGLSYLHSNGVVHGDLKSANVVITQNHVPMLMDFGISHLLKVAATSVVETATSAAQRNSLRWAAPELLFTEESECEDDVHTRESDIWALGMTYLEVLTKNLPYAHLSSDHTVMGSLFQKRIPRPPDDWQSWTESKKKIWGLCLRCWNFSPLERPLAEQLALDLE